MYQAKDVMTTKVVSISPEASVADAVQVLIDGHISGVPVIDGQGRLVGIISEFQLLEMVFDPRIKSAPVGDLMTRDPLTVAETTSLSDVASLFVLHRIRRLPVLRDDRVVGVIARRDLLKYMLREGEAVGTYIASGAAMAE
jgi:CBS domain-containing protein